MLLFPWTGDSRQDKKDMDMERKVVLVTGASSGIGQDTARILSKDYRLVLCGRDEERLKRTLEECEGDDHLLWPFDLELVSDIHASLADVIKRNELKVYGLAHCAGMIKYLPVKFFSVREFEQMFKVNVIAAAMLLKTLVSSKYNGSTLRSVVFVSSNISNYGAIAHCLYSASKSALDGLMRSAAMELAPKIRVNSVLPGGIHTRMTEDIFSNSKLVEKMAVSYPLGLGKAEDIANAIRFLLSDESSWITGQQLTVDGGRTINLTV